MTIQTMTILFREQTRDVGPLTMRADVRRDSINVEKRTVDVMFSTGAKVLRNSWYDGPSYEELSLKSEHVRMARLNSGSAPLLIDHVGRTATQVGVIERAWIDNGQGWATVRFSKRADVEPLFQDVVDGIVRSVSVGYRTYKAEKVEVAGDAKIPTMRATDWEPYEISTTPLPAEVGAGFRSEQMQFNPCVFVTRSEGEDVEPKTPAVQPPTPPAAPPAPENRAAPVPAQVDADQVRRSERERIVGIQHAARAAKLGDKFVTEHVEKGTALDAVRTLALGALAASTDEVKTVPHTPVIERGEEDREKWLKGASAAIFHRSGMAPMLAAVTAGSKDSKILGVRHEFKGFDPDDNGGDFRHLSLYDLAREACERAGMKTRGMSKEQIVGAALQTRAGGQATISDFPVLLENVMYKTLLGAYAQAADSWRRFAGVDSVQDFRPANRYRTGSFGTLPVVAESAEFQNVALPDGAKQQITTETRGQMLAISRQAIINDDMGALTDTAGKFGRMAGLSIEKAVYDKLAENSGLGPTVTYNGITAALFDAQFANISTGAALSMAAIEADRVKMAQQKDISNNEFLDLRPASILLPIGLGGIARQINRDEFDPTAASAHRAPNIVYNLFRDIIDTPRLTGTRRYLFTDQVNALLVVFLNGSQAPFMEQQVGWRVDGIEWKLRLDFKAQGFDPKGALTNAGV